MLRLLAATIAVIKANARLANDVWRSLAGTKHYTARGNFTVATEFTPEFQGVILKTVASVIPATTKQLQKLSGPAVEDFPP